LVCYPIKAKRLFDQLSGYQLLKKTQDHGVVLSSHVRQNCLTRWVVISFSGRLRICHPVNGGRLFDQLSSHQLHVKTKDHVVGLSGNCVTSWEAISFSVELVHICWLCTADVIKCCCVKLHCMLGCRYILSSVCLLFILICNLHFCPRGRWGLVLHTYFHMLMVNKNRSCTGCAVSRGLSKIPCLTLMSEKSRMKGERIFECICYFLSCSACLLLYRCWKIRL
jgi:hypothetical protein